MHIKSKHIAQEQVWVQHYIKVVFIPQIGCASTEEMTCLLEGSEEKNLGIVSPVSMNTQRQCSRQHQYGDASIICDLRTDR